jgi:hypothetical protein
VDTKKESCFSKNNLPYCLVCGRPLSPNHITCPGCGANLSDYNNVTNQADMAKYYKKINQVMKHNEKLQKKATLQHKELAKQEQKRDKTIRNVSIAGLSCFLILALIFGISKFTVSKSEHLNSTSDQEAIVHFANLDTPDQIVQAD